MSLLQEKSTLKQTKHLQYVKEDMLWKTEFLGFEIGWCELGLYWAFQSVSK